MDAILPALITGGLAPLGVIITNVSSNRSVENKIITAQAVTDTKIEALKDEVAKHNNFASRVPVIEQQVKSMDRRIDGLEKAVDSLR